MAQNEILFTTLGLYRICRKTSKKKSKIITQLREVAEGLKMKLFVISYAGEPRLASQQFIQEYNRKRSIEEELRQKLQQGGEELRTMSQITSLFHST